MSHETFTRCASALALAAALSACGKSSTPTQPTPPTTANPNIAITSMSIAGESRTSGYAYRVVIRLRESAGTAATISSVDLTFMTGATAIISSHHERPIAEGTSVCPASGTVDTRELVTTDGDSAHPYATSLQATVTFTDGRAFVAAANASADVPPISAPPAPPPPSYTLTGVITDIDTHAGIEGARLEIRTGSNAGKTATTDRTGTYVLRDLVADTFRLRASADDFLSGEQGVTVPDTPRADFELRRIVDQSCAYAVAVTGAADVSYRGGQSSVAITRTSGICSWQASVDVNWITFPGATSGSGNGSLTYLVSESPSLNSRSGTITISWTGGSTQLLVRQGPRPDWECFVSLTKGPQDFGNVPPEGGQLTVLASGWAIPSGWSGQCRASVTSSVSWISGRATVGDRSESVTFTVAPNPVPGTTRAGLIVATSGDKTVTLSVKQQ